MLVCKKTEMRRCCIVGGIDTHHLTYFFNFHFYYSAHDDNDEYDHNDYDVGDGNDDEDHYYYYSERGRSYNTQ